MSFTNQDKWHVEACVWSWDDGWMDTPCNVNFAARVDADEIRSISHVGALIHTIRKATDVEDGPVCAFSITEKERGWGPVNCLIKIKPEYFQTITTKSRHGNYKVMWVFFKRNGRKF